MRPRHQAAWKPPSAPILVWLLALLLIGTVFVHSASTGGAAPFPGMVARAHLLRIALGLGLFWFFLRVDYRRLEQWAWPLFLVGLGALVLLLGIKSVEGGVVRWIQFAGVTLQPSEPVKLFTVLLLARLLKPTGRSPDAPRRLYPLVVTACPVLLVALQPDLGTAMVIPPVLFAMLWVSGISLRRLLSYLASVAAAAPLIFLCLHPYQKARLMAFIDPDAHEFRNIAYQLKQSLIAIGSGGPTGKGLYLGSMSYLELLPESHNDFIFGVIGEEWGLWGTLTVTTLYLLLYLSSARIAFSTREPFGRLVALGITVQLAFQTCVNLGMTVGLAPVTGLPLPFISYGGSSLLTSLASMGVILGIGMRPVRIVRPDGLRAGTGINHDKTLHPRRGVES